MPHKTYFNWSSGKDASMALHSLLKNPEFEVERLVTSINEQHERVSMHGLHKELLIAQTKSIGIPLATIELPEKTDMQTYNNIMSDTTDQLLQEGFTHAAFGDIFLEDLRTYREEQLAAKGIKAVFPLWKKDTKELMHQFLQDGFKAITVCVSNDKLGQQFVGREVDETFLNELPDDVDPCGENGEFHTFCYDGPIFDYPIVFEKKETIYREYEHDDHAHGFWFQELQLK